jgi:hypothetical protein
MIQALCGLIRGFDHRKSSFDMHTLVNDRFCDEMDRRASISAHITDAWDQVRLLTYMMRFLLANKDRDLHVLAEAAVT